MKGLISLIEQDIIDHSIDYHGGADDYTCAYCNHRRQAVSKARDTDFAAYVDHAIQRHEVIR